MQNVTLKTSTSLSHLLVPSPLFEKIERADIPELVRGDWASVKLITQRRLIYAKHFLAQILNGYGNAVVLSNLWDSFARRMTNLFYLTNIDIEQIIGKVKPPTVLKTGALEFFVNSIEWSVTSWRHMKSARKVLISFWKLTRWLVNIFGFIGVRLKHLHNHCPKIVCPKTLKIVCEETSTLNHFKDFDNKSFHHKDFPALHRQNSVCFSADSHYLVGLVLSYLLAFAII